MCGGDKTCGCGCEAKPSRVPARRARDERKRDATYEAAKRHARFLEANVRAHRDPPEEPSLVVGALYYLEWDAHDEGDEGTYVYGGVYAPTGAGMFRRVSRFPNQRVTLYLFPDEVRYLELLSRPRVQDRQPEPEMKSGYADTITKHDALQGKEWETVVVPDSVRARARFLGYRMVEGQRRPVWKDGDRLYAQTGAPAPPSSALERRAAPELFPGRVLTRSARATRRVWDEGIVGKSIARAAQFEGFRRIDDVMFGVWSANGVLYAQPRRP